MKDAVETTQMPAQETESSRSRWPSVVAVFARHAFILFAVIVLPPFVYDAVSSSRFREIEWLHFSGGATYPLYAAYLIAKLKNFRVKFILLHLILVLVVTVVAVSTGKSASMFVALLPTAASVLPLLGAVASWVRGSRKLAVTCLVSSLLALLVGVPLSGFIVYGMGMSAVGAVHY